MRRLLVLLSALFTALPAGAAYSDLYVFGDSLSDDGNAFTLSGGIWPPSPPYDQRFSNGPVAAERLAADLGIALAPSTAGGTDYAVGGATTGTLNFNFETQSPFPLPATLDNTGVLSQIAAFAGSATPFVPSSSLFLVWAAPNDFFLALADGADLATAAQTALGNLATSITTLVGLGATDILVPNMVNLADTPFGLALAPADRALLGALSEGFDDALALLLLQLQATLGPTVPDLNLMGFDTAGFFAEVLASPADFGFSDVADPCFADPAAIASDCAGYLFVDDVHPTAAAHALLGDRFFLGVTAIPEPPAWTLVVAAAALLVAMRRRQPGARKR